MKKVDLEEPPSFLDLLYLECTQRECKPNEIFIEEYRKMFGSRISAGATEIIPGWEKPTQRRLRGPTTWKDVLKNALKELRTSEQIDRAVTQIHTSRRRRL